MDTPVLNDNSIDPNDDVLSKHLGKTKAIYDSMLDLIAEKHPSFTIEWNFYNDGKSWLCKVMKKKKTIFWISIWEQFFKVTFYFGLKYDNEIQNLKIDDRIKSEFLNSANIGKIKPLCITVTKKAQLDDFMKLLEFKEKLK